MDVVAFLPEQLLAHLRLVLGTQHSLKAVHDWSALEDVMHAQLVDVLVVDPAVSGRAATGVLQQLRRRYPSTPVLIYTVLSAAAMQAVVQLARAGVDQVVLHRFDDEPLRFRELLELAPAQALVDQVMRALEVPFARLPLTLVEAVEEMLRTPDRFRNAQDLAAAAGLHPRTVHRALLGAGLPSARLLVMLGRLTRAYVHLRSPGRSIREVAGRTGYYSPWQLTQQMRELTGYTPSTVRRRVPPDRFVSLVVARLRRALAAGELGEASDGTGMVTG